MNKTLNTLLIVAAVLFGSGVLVFGVAASTVGFNLAALSTSKAFTYADYTSSKAFSSITISEDNAALKVVRTSDSKLTIHYGENNLEKYVFDETSSALTVSVSSSYRWFDLFNWTLETKVLTVYLPASYAGTLSMSTKNGAIAVEGYHGGALALSSKSGSITANDVASLDKASFVTDNGSIVIDTISASVVTLEDSNGYESVKNLSGTKSLSVKIANGSIAISAIEVTNSILLHSSNGSISGDVEGPSSDYTIISSTSLGSNTLPTYLAATTGTKSLTAETSLGSINLLFQ